MSTGGEKSNGHCARTRGQGLRRQGDLHAARKPRREHPVHSRCGARAPSAARARLCAAHGRTACNGAAFCCASSAACVRRAGWRFLPSCGGALCSCGGSSLGAAADSCRSSWGRCCCSSWRRARRPRRHLNCSWRHSCSRAACCRGEAAASASSSSSGKRRRRRRRASHQSRRVAVSSAAAAGAAGRLRKLWCSLLRLCLPLQLRRPWTCAHTTASCIGLSSSAGAGSNSSDDDGDESDYADGGGAPSSCSSGFRGVVAATGGPPAAAGGASAPPPSFLGRLELGPGQSGQAALKAMQEVRESKLPAAWFPSPAPR